MNKEIKEINIRTIGQLLDYVETVEKAKELIDYITNLHQENERLKEDLKGQEKLTLSYCKSEQDYKSRCEKASEYIDDRMEEFKNAGSTRKNIKAHHYYMLLTSLSDILRGDRNE